MECHWYKSGSADAGDIRDLGLHRAQVSVLCYRLPPYRWDGAIENGWSGRSVNEAQTAQSRKRSIANVIGMNNGNQETPARRYGA